MRALVGGQGAGKVDGAGRHRNRGCVRLAHADNNDEGTLQSLRRRALFAAEAEVTTDGLRATTQEASATGHTRVSVQTPPGAAAKRDSPARRDTGRCHC